jgi:hypothetical protein
MPQTNDTFAFPVIICVVERVPIAVGVRTQSAESPWIAATRFSVDNHAARASGSECVSLNLDEFAVADRLQGEAAANRFTNENLSTGLGRCALRTTESITNESRVTIIAVLKDNNLIAGPGCGPVLTLCVDGSTGGTIT